MTPLINRIEITVCADDYAQNKSISEGIVHLAERGRISATSCMVNSTCWRESYPALQSLQSTFYVGLHFNLTHGEALSSSWKKTYGTTFAGMTWLLKQACLRRLNPDVVAAEVQAQLDAYTQAMNALPDFIDGHQHAHQLPVIRDVLLAVYTERLSPGYSRLTNPAYVPRLVRGIHRSRFSTGSLDPADKPWDVENVSLPCYFEEIPECLPDISIRKTSNGWLDLLSTDGFPKRQLIALLGGIAFHKRLTPMNLPTNTSFSGIYNFKEAKHYRHFFKRFIKHSRDGGLIMCHPGNPSEDISDPLQAYRHLELDYLMSDDYLSDLASHACQLKRKGV